MSVHAPNDVERWQMIGSNKRKEEEITVALAALKMMMAKIIII